MRKKSIVIITISICLLLSGVMRPIHFGHASPDQVKKFDLIVRTEITINRPAAAVWPFLFKPRDWKTGIGTMKRIAGEPNKEGETILVSPEGGEENQGLCIKYVRVDTNKQLVIKISPINNDRYMGFSDFSLFESNRKTHMIYDVYAEYRFSGMSDEEVEKMGLQIYEGTKDKLDSENQKLKELVEASK